MKKAPIPSNEKERLKKLQEYQVLDTSPENEFDQITQLAASICETKISLVSLVDHDRQWFKSSFGLDASETPRDISFCGHAIISDDVFIVKNAELDENFCDNPLFLNAPNVRFYAGAPLITPSGERIGTLCVIDDQEKDLTPLQVSTLKILANNVVSLFELKIKNEELKRINEFSSDIQKISHTGGWELDIKTSLTSWTDEVYDIYKIKKGTPVNKINAISYYAEHEQERLLNLIDKAISEQSPYDETFEFYDHEKNKKWVRAIGKPLANSQGEVIKLIGTFQDVTQFKEKENEALNKSKYLELALDGAKLGIWEWEIGSNTVTYDKKWTQMLGIDPKAQDDIKMEIETWQSRVHPEDLGKCNEKFQEYSQGLTERYEVVYRIRHEDGHWTHFLTRGKFSEFDEQGNPTRFTGTSLDITDKILLENQLQHTQKLAAIGELAAGVGHEINNPLTIINGYISSIERSLTKDEKGLVLNSQILQSTEKISNATERIAKIVRGLRTFSRSDDSEIQTFSISELMTESIDTIKEIYSTDGVKVLFNEKISSHASYIRGNRGRIQQVVMNLIANAKDASSTQQERLIEIDLFSKDNKINLIFSDNGCGMDQELKEKIFQPFFTTKEINKGTGIGLSLVQNIVKEHHGEIKIDSELNKGSKFTILFPSDKNHLSATTFKGQEEEKVSCSLSNLNFLIVEDESSIQEIVSSILEERGARVFLANNGKEGLKVLEENKVKFDIVISDVKMPIMSGTEFLMKTKNSNHIKHQPKFIFMTGGVNINFEDKNNKFGKMIDGYFLKPFAAKDVYKKIIEVLEIDYSDKIAS